MKPGRDLDALIAEKVMGWKLILSGKWEGHWEGDFGIKHQDGYLHSFSTDISAAWLVFEKALNKEGYTIRRGSKYWIIELRYENGCGMGTEEIARAETAPHAICLAALKAVGVEANV